MLKVIQYTIGMSNGFFVRDGKAVIAVDSGGEMGAEPFLEACRQHGIDPRDIKLLVVTHGHVDHFVNIAAMKDITKAPLLCHKRAAPFLREGRKPEVYGRNALGRAIMERQAIEGDPIPFVPKVEPDIVFEGAYDLKPWGIDGEIIETPGHSQCSTAVILKTGEAIVGDTVLTARSQGELAFSGHGRQRRCYSKRRADFVGGAHRLFRARRPLQPGRGHGRP